MSESAETSRLTGKQEPLLHNDEEAGTEETRRPAVDEGKASKGNCA
jgi:hypothetical protein